MSIWDSITYRKKLLLVAIITTASVYLGFRYILPLIFPFIISYFLAWTVRPATEFLYRKLKVPRVLGGSISLILLISVLGVGLSLLINNLIKQIVSFLKNMPIYLNHLADKLDSICGSCDKLFGLSDGTVRLLVDDNLLQTVNRVKNNIIPGITEHTISLTIRLIAMLGIVLIIFISAVLIAKDLPSMKESMEKAKIYRNIHKVTEKLAETGIAYLRAQLIIMVIVGFFCVLGLTLIKYEYALL
ncbi:MAG TPA: AI-2E family transporter, partial [Clostridiales bacterium]|nr:AI-2E family transporter [Clostridiales bacterium]